MIEQTNGDRVHALGRKPSVAHEQIIEAAWKLFEKHGYDATRTADIAEAVGISKRSLFNYFEVKEALLYPGSELFFDAFKAELEKRPLTEPLLESCAVCLSNLRDLMDNPDASFTAGPEVLRARLGEPAVKYSRDLWAKKMNLVLANRLGAGSDAQIKAGFVSAIVAQAWTEAIRISRESEGKITPQKAITKVIKSLGDLLG